jgi:hypothetical protein
MAREDNVLSQILEMAGKADLSGVSFAPKTEGKVPDIQNDKPETVIKKLSEEEPGTETKAFEVTPELVSELAQKIGAAPELIPELTKGIKHEQEHLEALASCGGDIKELVARLTLDHLKEIPDYYTRLAKMEEEAKKLPAEKPAEGPASGLPKEIPTEMPPNESKIKEGIETTMAAEYKAECKKYDLDPTDMQNYHEWVEEAYPEYRNDMGTEARVRGIVTGVREDITATAAKATIVADNLPDEAEAKKVQSGKPGAMIKQDPKTKRYSVEMPVKEI